MRQYRVTSPGGYEDFYSDYDAAYDHYARMSGATLEYADESTGHKWRAMEFRKQLSELLRFDV